MKQRSGHSRSPPPPAIIEESVDISSSSSHLKKSTPPNSLNTDGNTPFYERQIPATETMNTISPPTSGNGSSLADFDGFRREATKLERQLEDRVARYQQLAQSLSTTNTFSSSKINNRPTSLLDAAENGALTSQEESTLSTDISRTISAMADLVNTKMAPIAVRTGRTQHSLLVKRYREILFDCTTDYEKTRASVARQRETAELFAGANTGEAGEGETDQLLRERNAIGNSMKGVSSVLGQAEEIRSDLKSQGMALRGTSAKVLAIAQHVPGVNKLIDHIRKKRNRDDMVVSGIVGACILFTLWYIFAA